MAGGASLPAVLLVAPHFPTPEQARDGQGLYVLHAGYALAKQGCRVHVLALGFPGLPATERVEGISVRRVAPPQPLESVFQLYSQGHLRPAMHALAQAALEETQTGNLVAWCHGYECGEVAQRISSAGVPVVGVLHYLVAQESLHDLAVGDDSTRRRAFRSPLANLAGSLCPPPLRPRLVRSAAQQSHWAQTLPAPTPIKDQFQKLALESMLCRHAHALVAVGPRFARTVSTLYPETSARLRSSRAGVPPTSLAPSWPWPREPHRVRALAVGRPTGQKGWDYLAEALARLESRRPALAHRLDLVIAGGLGDVSSPWSHFSHRVGRSLRALSHVRVHNAQELPHQEVLALMQGADLLLHPAVFEPFGLVILEAMSQGCSILTTNADGPADLVRPPWGHKVPFDDPARRVKGLEDALEEQLGLTRAQRNAHGSAARQASQSFSWARCAEDHLAAMEAAVAASKAPSPALPRRTKWRPQAPSEAPGRRPTPP